VAEHKNITDPNIHEPKGVATAAAGTSYLANGSGSGAWGLTPFDASSLSIERVLNVYSTTINQNPTGLGVANLIQVDFGPATNTASDAAMVDATGTVTFNQTGMYRIRVAGQYGRTGATGVSEVLTRVLVNGVQVDPSVLIRIGISDVAAYANSDTWLNIPAGTTLVYQIMRDTSGNDTGGLVGFVPNGGWTIAPSASLRVERFT
tara:strand:+ start:837 stop:1451 length:615 start_codon:yes stop_codon:yes gene_type:complete